MNNGITRDQWHKALCVVLRYWDNHPSGRTIEVKVLDAPKKGKKAGKRG